MMFTFVMGIIPMCKLHISLLQTFQAAEQLMVHIDPSKRIDYDETVLKPLENLCSETYTVRCGTG